MSTNGSFRLVFMALVATAAIGMGGCARQPQSTPDQVVVHLKMARVGGRPADLSPVCQAYVEQILTADEAVRASLSELIRVRDGEHLWPAESDQWFDIDAVQQKLDVFKALMSEEASRVREATLQRLKSAINAVPEGLLGAEDSRRIFVDAVWSALRWEFGDLRYLEAALMPMVAKHKLLYARALKHAAGLTTQQRQAPRSAPGYREVVELFFELRLEVLAKREAALERARDNVAQAERMVASLQKELATLNRTRPDGDGAAASTAERRAWIEQLIAYEQQRAAYSSRIAAALAARQAADSAGVEDISTQPSTQPETQATPP